LPTFDYEEEQDMDEYDPCMIPEMQWACGESKYALQFLTNIQMTR